MTDYFTEDNGAPSEPGIDIFVRNKRPTDLKVVHAREHGAFRSRLDLSGAHRLRHPARRAVVDGHHRLARLRRLLPGYSRLWPFDTAQGDERAAAEQPAARAHARRCEGTSRWSSNSSSSSAAAFPKLNLIGWSWVCLADGGHHHPGPDKALRVLCNTHRGGCAPRRRC